MQKIRRLYIIDCQQESISRQFESATRAPEVPVTVSFVLICSGLRVLLALLRGRSEAQARVVYIINHKVAWLLCRSRDDGEAAPKSKKGKTMTSPRLRFVGYCYCNYNPLQIGSVRTPNLKNIDCAQGHQLQWLHSVEPEKLFLVHCLGFVPSLHLFYWITFELIAPTSLALNIASRPISCALTNFNTALLELD